jgi:hypothetical protein
MAITQAICNSFKQELLEGDHDFDTGGDVFKLALYTSAATLDSSTTVYTSTNEISDIRYIYSWWRNFSKLRYISSWWSCILRFCRFIISQVLH